jgi:hypothetical protein
MKASLNSIQKTKNEKITLENVIEFVVQNYSAVAIQITVKNVTRTIPAVDSVSGIPSAPFSMSALGHPFDIEFEIVFPSGTGSVIIDYSTLKKC